jgi:hypothetical protein
MNFLTGTKTKNVPDLQGRQIPECTPYARTSYEHLAGTPDNECGKVFVDAAVDVHEQTVPASNGQPDGGSNATGAVEVRACAEYGAGVDAGWAPPRRSTVDAGSAFVLVNDHDPKPLYYQLAAENAGEFSWDDSDQERCASRGLRRQHERTPSRP